MIKKYSEKERKRMEGVYYQLHDTLMGEVHRYHSLQAAKVAYKLCMSKKTTSDIEYYRKRNTHISQCIVYEGSEEHFYFQGKEIDVTLRAGMKGQESFFPVWGDYLKGYTGKYILVFIDKLLVDSNTYYSFDAVTTAYAKVPENQQNKDDFILEMYSNGMSTFSYKKNKDGFFVRKIQY